MPDFPTASETSSLETTSIQAKQTITSSQFTVEESSRSSGTISSQGFSTSSTTGTATGPSISPGTGAISGTDVSEKRKLAKKLIIALAIGLGVALPSVIAVFLVLWRKRRGKQREKLLQVPHPYIRPARHATPSESEAITASKTSGNSRRVIQTLRLEVANLREQVIAELSRRNPPHYSAK